MISTARGIKNPPQMTNGKMVIRAPKKPPKDTLLSNTHTIVKPPRVSIKAKPGAAATQMVSSSLAGGAGKTRGGRKM